MTDRSELTVEGLLESVRIDSSRFPSGEDTPLADALSALGVVMSEAKRCVWLHVNRGRDEVPRCRMFSCREKAVSYMEREIRNYLSDCPGLLRERFVRTGDRCELDSGTRVFEVKRLVIRHVRKFSKYAELINFIIEDQE